MTPEERQMLEDLAGKIAQTPPPPRDPEAEQLIRTRIGSRPDALYLMTQTVLIQNLALEHAQQELAALKQQVAAAAPSQAPKGSFLGSAPGYGAPPPGYGAAPAPPPGYGAPPPGYGYGPAPQGGRFSGFLKDAAVTAAGVAAGALAFEGIRSMLGGGHHSEGFMGGPGPGSMMGGSGSMLGGGPHAGGAGGGFWDPGDESAHHSAMPTADEKDEAADTEETDETDDGEEESDEGEEEEQDEEEQEDEGYDEPDSDDSGF